MKFQLTFDSPLGLLRLSEENGFLVSLDWSSDPILSHSPLLLNAVQQLLDYFRRERREFDLPLAPRGTYFQSRVWAALQGIPFGSAKSYGALALELGSGARAIGGACGSNPIPILIPCHRVISTSGAVGGYSGPENVKPFLLNLESTQL